MTRITSASQALDSDSSEGESSSSLEVLSPYFTGLVIDDLPLLLEASYRVRYQVYCNERGFLPAEDYPDQLETDVFDAQSVHLGVVNTQGDLVATARLVQRGAAGLPMDSHCELFPDEPRLDNPDYSVVEISRLAVSRRYNQRAGDGFYGLQGGRTSTIDGTGRVERRGGGEIVLTLFKAIYQESRRRGFTHWVSASERSLRRLVAKYGFMSRAIGPDCDYYGIVSPCVVDLRDLSAEIASGEIPVLRKFLDGLEPEFWPAEAQVSPPCTSRR